MPLLVTVLVLPLVEIGLFVTLGAWFGLWGTLGIVLASALLGTAVLRRQGVVAMMQLRGAMRAKTDPGQAMADGALVFLAGAFLVLPGFLTSSLGLLLLVPVLRRKVAAWVAHQMHLRGMVVRSSGLERREDRPGSEADVIEGDFFEVDPAKRPTHHPSGWTRH